MIGKILLIFLLFHFTFSVISEKGDPYKFGVFIEKLALQNNLIFVEHELIKTVNNNPIKVYGLTAIPGKDFGDYEKRYATVINSLMHPRQKSTFTMIKKVAQELIVQYRSDPYITHMFKNTIVWFVPYTNIDGVLEVEKLQLKKQIEEMRKNMNFQNSDKCSRFEKGVDINRNFDYKYGTIYTSKFPCSIEYRGKYPFSEKQAQAIKMLYDHCIVTLAIDIHSYGDLWIYPFASDPKGLQIKKHHLYPLYQKIFQMFTNKGAKHQACHDSLKYDADGVYIDWALSKNAISFALEIGKTFSDSADDQIEKTVNVFTELIKINAPKYELIKTEREICIESMSMVPFKFWLGEVGLFSDHYSKIQPHGTSSCVFRDDEKDYEVIIEGLNEKENVEVDDLPEKNFDESAFEKAMKIMASGFAMFVFGGMICGLTFFCQTWISSKIFPANNQEKEKLKSETQEPTSQEIKQIQMIKDEEEEDN